MPKISMKDFGSDRISKTCVMFGVYFADVIFNSLHLYAHVVSGIAPPYSPKISRESINHVLRRRCNSYIFIAIIQTIAVYVICVFSVFRFESQNFSVHKNTLYLSIDYCAAACVPLVAVFILSAIGMKCAPFELCEIEIAMRGYERHLSLCQRDLAVGCIRGCHSLSNQRLGFAGTTNPDTLSIPQFVIEGGQEFQESIVLHQRFIKYAMETNKRLAMSGIFATDLRRPISKEDQAEPRYAMEGQKS